MKVTDAQKIKSVFLHDSIWPYISDDYSDRETWEPIEHDDVHFLMPDESACFMVHPHSRVLWEVHGAVLPCARGRSKVFIALVAEWLKNNTTCRHLITHIPYGNMRAQGLARASGMKQEGMLPKSFIKNGELIDQLIYGMEI